LVGRDLRGSVEEGERGCVTKERRRLTSRSGEDRNKEGRSVHF
jgi:hypothetical protein